MATHSHISELPAEILLHIFSYLDLPDLASIAHLAPELACLASDPALHRYRIRFVAPSRVQHSLFGESPQGLALRPTIGDLVHRGVMCGLGIERRWRMGLYIYSQHSIIQYENGRLLARRHAGHVLSGHLRGRPLALNHLRSSPHLSHVLPDIESSSLTVSRSLLPTMRKLKWSFQRDRLAKVVRSGACLISSVGTSEDIVGFKAWLQSSGRGIVQEGERVRLGVCPDIRKTIVFFETN